VQVTGQLLCAPSQTYWPQEGVPGCPWATGEHVPFVAARLQASQPSLQVALQQTPFAQIPLPHWRVSEQLAPFA
jgi:hypothetical protein